VPSDTNILLAMELNVDLLEIDSNDSYSLRCNYTDGGEKVVCDDGETYESSQYYEAGEVLFYVYLAAYLTATLFAGECNILIIARPFSVLIAQSIDTC